MFFYYYYYYYYKKRAKLLVLKQALISEFLLFISKLVKLNTEIKW